MQIITIFGVKNVSFFLFKDFPWVPSDKSKESEEEKDDPIIIPLRSCSTQAFVVNHLLNYWQLVSLCSDNYVYISSWFNRLIRTF